jgi:hypothetical protein
MVELPDQRVLKLVRQVDEERQRRIQAERKLRGMTGQVARLSNLLRVRTTDTKPPEPSKDR